MYKYILILNIFIYLFIYVNKYLKNLVSKFSFANQVLI